MMRYLFLTVIVFVTVKAQDFTKEEVEKIKLMHESCIKETSVDRAVVENAMKGIYADDSKLKDNIYCLNKKFGFQNEAGDISPDTLTKHLIEKFPNEAMVTAAVKQCSQKKATPTETGFELVKCLHSFAPKDLDVTSFFN
nr:odorant binding protein 10 [Pagiophloeus tsushimanus]